MPLCGRPTDRGSQCKNEVARSGDACQDHKRCRARRTNGKRCRKRVKRPGERCLDHRGQPESPPVTGPKRRSSTSNRSSSAGRKTSGAQQAPRTSRETKSTSQQHDRVVRFCEENFAESTGGTVTKQVHQYVDKETVQYVLSGSPERSCKRLARLARSLLDARAFAEGIIGYFVLPVLVCLRVGGVERVLVQEVTKKLPLPYKSELTTVARILQVIGIWLCFSNGRSLTHCACLAGVLKAEGENTVKQLVLAAPRDWLGISGSVPPAG